MAQYAPNLPKVCKAAVCMDKGENYWLDCREDYPVPEVGKDEVLLRLNGTGLCASDLHYMKGDWGIPMPVDCAGHEGAGVVVGIGENVPKGMWKLGDRAGMKPLHDCCHACEYCRNSNETVCDSGPYTGMHFNGSYCEFVTSPALYTARIPDGVSDEVAGPIMCSGATVFAALRRAELKPGDWIVVLGAGGGVGSMCTTFANALGYRVIGVDTSDEKAKLVKSMGAEIFIDFMKSKDPAAEVAELTGGGAHAAIGCGSSAKSYEGAYKYLRKTGTLVAVGIPSNNPAIAIPPLELTTRKLNVRGSLVGSMDEIRGAFDLVSRGKAMPHVTTYPWKEFAQTQKLQAQSQITGRAYVSFKD